ncbi:MAG: hypothetical protein Q9225_000567 [Loekoesia sp. 1 TL-2023]
MATRFDYRASVNPTWGPGMWLQRADAIVVLACEVAGETNPWFLYQPLNLLSAKAVFNVVINVKVMALPITVTVRLQITRKKRIKIDPIFFVGLFATVTLIVRMTTLRTGSKNNDIRWTTSGGAIWSAIEMKISIVCACLFILRVPLQSLFPRLLGQCSAEGSLRTSAGEDTPGASGGCWKRITTSRAMTSRADDKSVEVWRWTLWGPREWRVIARMSGIESTIKVVRVAAVEGEAQQMESNRKGGKWTIKWIQQGSLLRLRI